MRHFRLTINRRTKQATVEQKTGERADRPWRFMGQVRDQETAEDLIRRGWPDEEDEPTQETGFAYTLEVIR